MANAAEDHGASAGAPRTAACWAGLFDTASECDKAVTEIEGTLPEGLVGTLYRNGPGRKDFTDSFFDGDGMLRTLRFDGRGGAHYRARYLETEKYLAERGSDRPLRRMPGTNLPGGVLGNAFRFPTQEANTNILPWADRLFALGEGGHPYEVDPVSLDTGALTDFGGALHARTAFTAHPHVDPDSGEVFAFGSHFGGGKPSLKAFRLDSGARLHDIGSVPLDGMGLVHDFALSKKWMAFFVPPMQVGILRFLLGFDDFFGALKWRPERGLKIALLSREGGDPILLESESCMAGHVVSAWDEGDELFVDMCQLERWDQMGDAAADYRASDWGGYARSRIRRYRIDPTARRVSSEEICSLPAEFPRIDPRRECASGRYGYFIANTHADEGGWFRAVLKLDRESGETDLFDFGRDAAAHEAVFIPRPDGLGDGGEDDGWLVSFVHSGPERSTRVVIFDARSVSDGPICSLNLRENAGITFHGNWVPA